MKRLAVRTVCVVLCGALTAAVLFAILGGFTVANGWKFEGQMVRKDIPGSKVGIWVDTKVRSVSLLGVQLYVQSSRPYNMGIQFEADDSTSVATASISKATIRYASGSTNQLLGGNERLVLTFRDHEYSNWMSNHIVKFHTWRALGLITNCIDRNEPFVFNCTGTLQKDSGETTSFATEWSFKPEKTLGVFPGIHFERPAIPW